MKKLSIIVPCYNEEECLNKFYQTIKQIMDSNKIKYELILVDDGSKDDTLKICKEISKENNNIHFISFSRNFGKEAGMYAGLKKSSGEYTVIMDADLQHDPNLLVDMIKILDNEDYDSVGVCRKNRNGEKKLRSFFSKKFYSYFTYLTEIETMNGEMDYRMMNRKFVDAVLSFSEYHRFSKGLFRFVGFKTKWIYQENKEREAGSTKWNIKSLIKYSIEGITSFSVKPLYYILYMGIFLNILSFIFLIVSFFIGLNKFKLLTFMIMFIPSIIIICLGISSIYLSKIYFEVKNRPVYIIRECDINE